MTFIFPANGKNSTSAVCLWRSYAEMSSFVFVLNVGFFSYLYEGLILNFRKLGVANSK